jgi:hypothetical protein
MEAEGPLQEADASPSRAGRRLPDRVLAAFHAACDQHELAAAEQLLAVLEALVMRATPAPDPNRRRALEALVAAQERLWYLRHPDAAGR